MICGVEVTKLAVSVAHLVWCKRSVSLWGRSLFSFFYFPKISYNWHDVNSFKEKMRYDLDTLEFSRKRVDLFLSMRHKDKLAISGFDASTWSKWCNGERHPSMATLEELAAKFSAAKPTLFGLNPMEMLAGILIMRSRTLEKRQKRISEL
jgi:hypothetical protein